MNFPEEPYPSAAHDTEEEKEPHKSDDITDVEANQIFNKLKMDKDAR